MEPGRDYASGTDSYFLILEKPNNICQGSILFTLDQRISKEQGRIYTEDLARFVGDRFVRRLVKDERPGGRPYFGAYPEFNIDNHYSFEDLGVSATFEDVTRSVLDKYTYEMDLQHPVWGVKLFHYGTDKCAFAFRMHHVLSDGQGILLAISNWSAGFNGSGKAVKRAPNPLFDKPPPAPLPPSREEWSSYIKQFYQDVSQYGSVRKSPWFNSDEKNQNGVWHKQASTSKLIPITELRRCKAAIGCNNVNDIAVAMITGAFSRVLKAKNCELDEYFCYMIPKSYRTAQDPDLCNRIDFLHVYVPTSIESLLERSHKVSELMGKAKTKPHGDVPYRRRMSLVNVWDLRRDADAAFLRRTHAVISNIPEPPNPITFGPIKTTSYSGFGPLSSVGALFFTLVTQQGRISLSVQMDEDRGPSATEFYAAGTAKELCDAFDAEYEELGRIVSEIEKSNGVKVVRKTESEVSPGVEARL